MSEQLGERTDIALDEAAQDRSRLTKAERLEAKAARLREAEERRAVAAAAGRAPTPRRWLVLSGVLGVLVAALVAALVVSLLAWQDARGKSHDWHAAWQRLNSAATAREQALAAAKTFAVDFGSYDYQHLDADFAEVARRMTPDFRSSYLQTSDRLKPTFEQYRTQVTAHLEGAGLSSFDGTKAVAVVFLDQTVQTSQSSTPRLDRNRLEAHLVYVDGKWLVQKLLAK